MQDVDENFLVGIEFQIQAGIDPVMKCMAKHPNLYFISSLQQQQGFRKAPNLQLRQCDDDEDFVLRFRKKALLISMTNDVIRSVSCLRRYGAREASSSQYRQKMIKIPFASRSFRPSALHEMFTSSENYFSTGT